MGVRVLQIKSRVLAATQSMSFIMQMKSASLIFCFLLSQTNAQFENSTSWHKYVRSPTSRTVYPAKILSATGGVQNAESLVHQDGETLLIRNSTSDPPPVIIIDFGINVVGYPQVSFAGASNNTPGVRLTFSE